MTKLKFKWGQWVTVSAVVRPATVGRLPTIKRVLKRNEQHFVGRIAGVAYRQEGTITPNREDDPGFLDATRTVRLYRVAVTWRNQVLCFEEDLEPAPSIQGQDLPFQVFRKMTEKEKAEIRKVPRDAKGRWS